MPHRLTRTDTLPPPVDFLFQESLRCISIPLKRDVSARISQMVMMAVPLGAQEDAGIA